MRRPGAATLVSERRCTTWPSRSSWASGGGGVARSSARSRSGSSSIRNAPARAHDVEHLGAALGRERGPVRVGEHRLAGRRAGRRRRRARRRAGRAARRRASVGTGTTREAGRARRGERAEVGRRLDDQRSAGRRQPAQARSISAACPPGGDERRRARVRPPPSLGANQRAQAVRAPRSGPRPQRRAAGRRARAPPRARRAAAGRRAGSRVESTSTPGGGGRSRSSSAERVGPRARPSASVCQARSGARRRPGARGDERAAAGARLDEPARGERCTARWTVCGPARWRRHQLAHRRQPVAGRRGQRAAAQLFRHRSTVLSSAMSTVDNAIAPPPVTRARVGLARLPRDPRLLVLASRRRSSRVEGLDPWFVAFGRAAVAGLLAAAYLAAVHAPRPTRAQARRLGVVAGGVDRRLPAASPASRWSRASRRTAPSSIALLPAATALAAVARAGERPGPAVLARRRRRAASSSLTFALAEHRRRAHRRRRSSCSPALALCALGYAEGGVLAATSAARGRSAGRSCSRCRSRSR